MATTHQQVLREIEKVRATLQKRLVAAIVQESRSEREVGEAIDTYRRVHAKAQERSQFVKAGRHQSLLDTIDKRQAELLAARERRREIEEEHRAYFQPLTATK